MAGALILKRGNASWSPGEHRSFLALALTGQQLENFFSLAPAVPHQ